MKYDVKLKELIAAVNSHYMKGLKMYSGDGVTASTYCQYQFECQYDENDFEYHFISVLLGRKLLSTYNKIHSIDYKLIHEAFEFFDRNELPDEFNEHEKKFIYGVINDVRNNIDGLIIV